SNPSVYLVDPRYIDLPLTEFKKYPLENREIRKILVYSILECYRSYPDEKRRLLRKLYEDLDLDLFAIINLNSLRTDSLISAIDELASMEVFVEKYRMLKFLKHRNSAVRCAARVYLLRTLGLHSVSGISKGFSQTNRQARVSLTETVI